MATYAVTRESAQLPSVVMLAFVDWSVIHSLVKPVIYVRNFGVHDVGMNEKVRHVMHLAVKYCHHQLNNSTVLNWSMERATQTVIFHAMGELFQGMKRILTCEFRNDCICENNDHLSQVLSDSLDGLQYPINEFDRACADLEELSRTTRVKLPPKLDIYCDRSRNYLW